MDRKELKLQARQTLDAASPKPWAITLILLLCGALLLGVDFGVVELMDRAPGGGEYLSQALSAQTRNYLVGLVVSLACQLLLVLLWMGYSSFSLKLYRREEWDNRTLLDGARIWSKALLLYLYLSVLVALWGTLLTMPLSYALSALYLSGVLTMAETMDVLMILVAIVMGLVSYRYRMAWFLLLDAPEKPIRAIVTEARGINQTHRLQLFLLDMSFVPWLLLSLLTLGILLIWKLPYITLTYAGAYNHMLTDYADRQRRLEELIQRQGEELRRDFRF